jgi:hypothetical protein
MSHKLLLVDFENVHQVDLGRLGDNFHVVIFVGSSQKNVPIDLVASAQKLGDRVEWQRVEGNGSNALDFYIAYQLGRVIEKSPSLHCIVLSKDKGFDPLLRHLNKNGLKCKRINSLLELEPKLQKGIRGFEQIRKEVAASQARHTIPTHLIDVSKEYYSKRRRPNHRHSLRQ